MQEELLWSACFFFRAMGSPSPLPGIVLLDSLPGHQPSNASETNHGSNSHFQAGQQVWWKALFAGLGGQRGSVRAVSE